MKGKTTGFQLSQLGSTAVNANFQLPKGQVSPPKPAPKPENGFHSQGLTIDQVEVMLKALREQVFETGNDGGGEKFAFTEGLQAVPGDPEWVFHGTTVPWDTIHDSGALLSVGDNTNVDEHVKSSRMYGSAYVATARELSVAMSFAKQTGWVYLIYAACGLEVKTHRHQQAEVIIPGSVPVHQIFMFKSLTQPHTVYRNLEFKGPTVDNSLVNHGLRLMGGGN